METIRPIDLPAVRNSFRNIIGNMISSFEEATRVLRSARILGLAPRPLYLLPLLRTGTMAALVTREAADRGWAEHFGTEMISLEQLTRTRGGTTHRRDRKELISGLPAMVGERWRGTDHHLASYGRSGARWRAALEGLGVRLGTATAAIPAIPTDKIAMRDWLSDLGVHTPASLVVEDIDYPALRRSLGPAMVAQTPRGSGGSGTFLVTDQYAADALPDRTRWLVSEYAGDITVNVHGFVGLDGIPQVLRPSVQLTQVAGAGSGFGQYSGSDFRAPALLPGAVLAQCAEAMDRIGWGLSERGHRGAFGVDLAVRDDTAAVLEINCRVQGSSWLLGEVELAAGELPTVVRHVLESQGHATLGKPGLEPADGVQLTVRHTGAPARLTRRPAGGRYRLDQDRLRRQGDGYGLLECGADECVLVNVPPSGTVVHPGAILGRLVTHRSLTGPDGSTPTPYGRRVLAALPALHTFEPD